MRILLHDRTGVPFSFQLAKELGKRGYQVLYSYGAFFQSPKGNFSNNSTGKDNYSVEPIDLDKPFNKYSYIKRYFQEIKYAKRLLDQINRFDPDVLILAGAHPDAIKYIYDHNDKLDRKMIFWLQDIYGVAIKRILKERLFIIGACIGNFYIEREKKLLERSNEVILISEDFLDNMEHWKIDSGKIHVIRNWAPLDELPVKQKNNPWAERYGLIDHFCFLYAGTLGLKHNPALLSQLAVHYQGDPEVKVVVISEGLGANWLKRKKELQKLDNLMILDFQDHVDMPYVMGTSDILVAILDSDAGVYSAPSKVLTYLCSERPILAAIPRENLSSRIITECEAGVVVEPDNLPGFLNAADTLYNSSKLRNKFSENARIYAEKTFSIADITDRFELIINN